MTACHPRLLRASTAALPWALALALSATVQARDPTNMSECVSTIKPLIESQCKSMFTDEQKRSSCLQQVGPHVQQTCNQFFGEGQDFCATCTSSCTQNFPSGDPKRRECLSMCLSQPRCT